MTIQSNASSHENDTLQFGGALDVALGGVAIGAPIVYEAVSSETNIALNLVVAGVAAAAGIVLAKRAHDAGL